MTPPWPWRNPTWTSHAFPAQQAPNRPTYLPKNQQKNPQTMRKEVELDISDINIIFHHSHDNWKWDELFITDLWEILSSPARFARWQPQSWTPYPDTPTNRKYESNPLTYNLYLGAFEIFKLTENEMNYSLLTSENSILAGSFCVCGSLLHVSMFFLLLNQLCFSLLFFLDFLGNLFDLLLEVGGLLIQSRSGLQRNVESVQELTFRLGIQTKAQLLINSWHQTTKPRILFSDFFPRNFLSWAVEEENKLFIGPKLRKKNLFWTNKKFVFFFNCYNWETFLEKLGEKIGLHGGLMSRTSLYLFHMARKGNINCPWSSSKDNFS